MTCKEAQPLLMDFILRRLSAAETGAIDTHLGECEGCRTVVEEERALFARLSAVPQASPQRDLWAATRARALAAQPASALRQPWLSRLAPAARRPARRMAPVARPLFAAALATCAILAFLFSPGRHKPAPGPGTPVIAQTLDQARHVSALSDDPMGEMTDRTWDVLAVSNKGGPS